MAIFLPPKKIFLVLVLVRRREWLERKTLASLSSFLSFSLLYVVFSLNIFFFKGEDDDIEKKHWEIFDLYRKGSDCIERKEKS